MPTAEETDAARIAEQKAQLARAAAQLATSLTRPATKERLYEVAGQPRTLVRVFAGANNPYFCLMELEDIAPYRYTTAEERVKWHILSLSPPAVLARRPEQLVERISLAVQKAAMATPGIGFSSEGSTSLLGPADLAMIHLRAIRAVRFVLRGFGEDV